MNSSLTKPINGHLFALCIVVEFTGCGTATTGRIVDLMPSGLQKWRCHLDVRGQ